MEKIPLRIISIKGGNAPNAIPRDATADVYVTREQAEPLSALLKTLHAEQQREFEKIERVPANKAAASASASSAPAADPCPCAATKSEKKEDRKADGTVYVSSIQMTLEQKPYAGSLAPCSAKATQKALDVMLNIPHGVIRYQPDDPTEPETSTSFSLVALPSSLAPADISSADSKAVAAKETADATFFLLHTFTRSASDEQLDTFEKRMDALARISGASITKRLNYFPGWYPQMDTHVLRTTVQAHEDVFSSKPDVYSVHAGLECGWLQKVYPKLECVSIGPLVEDAHSPDEKLQIPSVGPFYKWLRRTVELLAKQPAA